MLACRDIDFSAAIKVQTNDELPEMGPPTHLFVVCVDVQNVHLC